MTKVTRFLSVPSIFGPGRWYGTGSFLGSARPARNKTQGDPTMDGRSVDALRPREFMPGLPHSSEDKADVGM